ncbi:MAG: ComEC/Rec2 family competence protein [Deltaproteobacteria bacterium]|nr:MAG: ComEC/Rec2 family competence protein [Deltaproteobacteria bacterium]
MIDNVYARPVIPLLISFISGIAFGAGFPDYHLWMYVMAVLGSGWMLCCIFRRDCRHSNLIASLILFVALGYLSIQPWIALRFPANHIIHYVDSHKWKITGVIDQNPINDKIRQKFILRTRNLNWENASHSVIGKLRVTVYGQSPELSRGNLISITGKIRSFNNFKNPGGFDYKRYMAFKGVWGATSIPGEQVVILKKLAANSFQQYVNKGRDKISMLIDTTPAGEHRGVLKALIIGERSQIPLELREAFNRAGVSHLLAISGLHIGIVGTTAFLFFSWLFSRFSIFLQNAWTRKGAALLSFFPILIYALLAGMSPSTQRALIMVAVFLMTFFFQRDQDLMNTLALAAMLILVVDPPSLFSISFQLSFVSVFSILFGLSRVQIMRFFNTNPPKMKLLFAVLKKLCLFLLVSVFAILGTFPIVMFYFNQVSLVGVLANFVIVPLVGFIAVPLGLLAVFISPVSVEAATWGIKASAAILIMAIQVVRFFSDLPFAAVKTITPSFIEISCYYLLAGVLLNLKPGSSALPAVTQTISKSKTGHQLPCETDQSLIRKIGIRRLIPICRNLIRKYRPVSMSRGGSAKLLLGVVIMVMFADAGYWFYQRFWRNDLRVTIIDVGQGEAVLMELPHGYCILVDGGGFSDNAVFDVGARVVAPYLWRKKIKSIDTVILTHPNSDHLNGLAYIARHFNVKNVWTNNEARNTSGFRQFMNAIVENKIKLLNFHDLSRLHEIEGVMLKILYPPKDFLKKRKKDIWRTPNNNSLVVKAIFGSKSFLFPGDILARAEKELVSLAGNELKSTVILTPHHGSISSSTRQFLEKVNPEIAVISAGWKNSFHFPHPEVLSRYTEMGCSVLRTDIQGAVRFTTNGKTLTVTPYIVEIKRTGSS